MGNIWIKLNGERGGGGTGGGERGQEKSNCKAVRLCLLGCFFSLDDCSSFPEITY